MYGFSTAVKNAYKAGARQGVTLTITPTTGTAITLTETNIVENSFAIDRMTSISGGIPFGTAYSNALSFTISDPSRTYAAFNWRGARIDVSLYVYVGTTRTLAGTGGRFYVKKHKAKVATVEVSALGSLSKLDTPFANAGASGTYTIAQVLQQVSQQIWSNTTTIDYSAVSSAAAQSLGAIKLPEGEDVTCRNIVGWCAALCGASVIEHGSADGLVLIRKGASGETINSANRFSGDSGEDVAITGVKGYDAAGNEVSHTDGSADEYNLIIQSNGIYENAPNRASILSALYTALVGFSMTPFSADTLAMPWLECGDTISYVDAGGTTHSTFVTHIRITLGGRTEISCDVASLEERDANVNIAPYIERSSITRQDLRTDAIKSSNYSYSSGTWANAGTFLDLANGTITSMNFAIAANGDAYIRGTVNASAGNIGDLTIGTSSAFPLSGTGLIFTNAGDNANTLLLQDRFFMGSALTSSYFSLYARSGTIELDISAAYGGTFKSGLTLDSLNAGILSGEWSLAAGAEFYLEDDAVNTLTSRIQALENGGGGGGVGGSGTANYIPKWTNTNTLGDSFVKSTTSGIQVDSKEGTTTRPGNSVVTIGNLTPINTAGNTVGRLELYGWGSGKTTITYNCSDATNAPYYIQPRGDRNQYFVSVDTGSGTNPSTPTNGAIPKFNGTSGYLTNSEIAGTSLASDADISHSTYASAARVAFFDSTNVIRKANKSDFKTWLGDTLSDYMFAWNTLHLSGFLSYSSSTNTVSLGYPSFLAGGSNGQVPISNGTSSVWTTPPWLTSAVTGIRNSTSGAFSTGDIELIKGSVSSTTELSITKSTPSTGVTRFTFNLFNSCLIAGTKILMADNTEKPIEEIKQGDEVASWDVNNGTRTTAIVVTAHATGADCEYTAHLFDDGSYIVVFGQHSVYNKTLGYPTDISKFREGDETYNANGEIIHYAGNTRYFSRAERIAHYDINTSNNLYYANGILNGKNNFAKYRAMKAEGMILPEAIQAVFDAQNAASDAIIGYETNPEYLAAIAAKLKEKSHISRLISEAKQHLADTDYLVNKWTEGILTAIEWLRAKTERAEWRDTVNTQEGLLATVESQLAAIKARFKSAHGNARTRFETLSLQDNYRLADYRAWLSTIGE